MKGTEANTQKAVLELLAAHKVFSFRINGGGFGGSHKGKKWFVRPTSLGNGAADVLALPLLHGGFVPTWIEVKSAVGKQSPEQVSFQQYVEKLGHNYLLIRDIDQLLFWLATIS